MLLKEISDLNNLMKPVDNIPRADMVATNGGYAHMYHFKKYANVSADMLMNCVVEHGFYTMYGAYDREVMHNVPAIITFSRFRKKVIEDLFDIEAIPIGPYIEYVDGFYSKDVIDKVKKSNGKTLLVMPAHSSREETKLYDYEELFHVVNSLSPHSFEKVIASLPIFDLQRGVHRRFQEKGLDVVAVGGERDCNYLRRLKSIIELSDAILANAFTTGLVYAVYLGKPVFMLNQSIGVKKEGRTLYRTKETEVVDEFIKTASDCKFENIEKQKEWGYEYAGFDCIKTKSEMHQILMENSKEGCGLL